MDLRSISQVKQGGLDDLTHLEAAGSIEHCVEMGHYLESMKPENN